MNDAPSPHDAHDPDTDLSARVLGATVVAASDEAFGEKEHLLDPAPVNFVPGTYGSRGEVVDGWETRRRRQPGNDWAIVRLGLPGRITSIDVDTGSFTGNFPAECLIEACGMEGYPGLAELSHVDVEWQPIVPRCSLRGDAHNFFTVTDMRCFTHVRLSTFPDGGVARLRVRGEAMPDAREVDGLTIDLASQQYGGSVISSNDGFYGPASTINRPDEAHNIGEGWEARRRRDDGHDHAVIRLGLTGTVCQAIIDTRAFRYNASAAFALWGHDGTGPPSFDDPHWLPLLPRTALQPDTRHVFGIPASRAIGWVRVDAFPDGGLGRVRLIGSVDPGARRRAGYRWFNALTEQHARACLESVGVAPDAAAEVLAARPLTEAWSAPDAARSVLARIIDGR